MSVPDEATSASAISSPASRRGAVIGHVFTATDGSGEEYGLETCANDNCDTSFADAATAADEGRDSICAAWVTERKSQPIADTRAELAAATGHPAESFLTD